VYNIPYITYVTVIYKFMLTNASFSKSKYNLIWHLSKNFDTPHELGYPLYVLIFLPATGIKEVRLEHVNIEGKISI
jgi:hypothetical protein